MSPTVVIPSTTADPHSVIQRTSEFVEPPFREPEPLRVEEEEEADKKLKT